MSDSLEAPGTDETLDWVSLYRSRGDEVEQNRPIFTGDVFTGLTVHGLSEPETKSVIIVQHPCALRLDGVKLIDRVMVAEVLPYQMLTPTQWTSSNHKIMPLPELMPDGKPQHYAAFFKKMWVVAADDFDPAKRVACMSQIGVNLLLQRWVHHNSRVVVQTSKYQDVSSGEFAEADIIEDWCEERVCDIRNRHQATAEAHEWLRSESSTEGKRWQDLLENPQTRSVVEKAKHAELKRLRAD